MNKKRFMTYNVIGAVIWASLVPLLGFWLGHKIHNIDKYLLPIILIATVFSFAPAGWHLFGKRDNRKIVLAKFKRSKTK
jgi:membrane protein DedA with SNARE-associated domain